MAVVNLIHLLLCYAVCLKTSSSQDTKWFNECACDLTGNSCDINCCCDKDCDVNDRLTFVCSSDSFRKTLDDRLCIQQSLVFDTHNTPYLFNSTNDGLLCIYYDNEPMRNYYIAPDAVNTTDDFNHYIGNYSSSTFRPQPPSSVNFTSFFKANDPVYTVSETNVVGFLRIPRGINSYSCARFEVLAFLDSSTSSCTEPSTDIEAACNSGFFSSDTYYKNFSLLKTPGAKTTANLYTSNFVVPIRTGQSHHCIRDGVLQRCPLVNSATFDGSRCLNSVVKVEYTFVHKTKEGISDAWVNFTYARIESSQLPLAQIFTTKFVKNVNAVSRSGNPGYVAGKPVVVGSLRGQSIELNTSESSNHLLILRPSADRSCVASRQNAVPVTFGEDVRTGCLVSVDQSVIDSNCATLIFEVETILSFGRPSGDNSYVAMYGNSVPEDSANWVKLIKFTTVTSSSCETMVLSAHYQFLYAKTGSLSNPQNKIIGAAVIYGQQQRVQSRCTGANCVLTEQKYEVILSVSFVDVSKPATGVVGEPPIFLAKLPNDFFYPFISGSQSVKLGSTSSYQHITFISLLSLWISAS